MESKEIITKENTDAVGKAFEEMLNKSWKQSIVIIIVIISDKTGTGKTKNLQKISQVLKEKNQTKWVNFFNLNQHVF